MKSKTPKAPSRAPKDTNNIINITTPGENCKAELPDKNAVIVTHLKDLTSQDSKMNRSKTGSVTNKFNKPLQNIQDNLTPENIALFRSTFKGREDIVSAYWQTKRRGGKSGYAFLCENKWDPKLCNLKKRVRGGCRKCKNAKYTPLSDELIGQHISGRRILGVYPLLQDNTCYFIAADFDKHKSTDPEPFEDVKKLIDVCEVQEIPCYVLRSKSGNGYHAYIFFSDAVPTWKARAVAFALLGEAGIIGDDIEISTFDRLFPNQSELSGKGFGNLISLPFQGRAGSKGHTLLLDPETDYVDPYQDQWKILSKLKKVSESDLDGIIEEWNLQQEVPKRSTADFEPIREEKNLADFNEIKNRCKFIKHCCDDAEKLSEPEWYSFLTIVIRCKDGRLLAHKYSGDHPSYNYDFTEAKLEHARKDTGPYKCKTIYEQLNSTYCERCLSRNKVKSPIVLGYNSIYDDASISIIKELNEKHAIIMHGGKCLVLNEIIEPIFKRPDFSLSSNGDFRNFYANKKITDPNNSKKGISIANIWLESPGRREYPGGIIFDPSAAPDDDYYNLWKGFAVEPKKGDWSLLENHIREIIANDKLSRFRWIMAWLARILQDPGGQRPGTSIVLRGKQGTGKGIFVNTFGEILGKHFLQIAQASQVTGRFNHHFKDVILAFVDEGVWAGDKQAEGVIKNLITEPFITVEQKNKDIIRVKNNVNMILGSNNDWVIPAGLEERRFFVIDVPDTRLQDHKYFGAIANQMENGGLAAMVYDLLELDISGVNLRIFEQTEGLFEQKLHSMTTVQKYWYERLLDGSLITAHGLNLLTHYDSNAEAYNFAPAGFGGEEGIVADHQHEDYLAFAESLNDRYPLPNSQFGIAIKKMCKKVKKVRSRKYGDRVAIRIFPSLEECRKEFEDLVKYEIDWE